MSAAQNKATTGSKVIHMKVGPMDREGARYVYETCLLRARDTGLRLAFATLVGSFRFWVSFVIGLPIATLLAALINVAFIPFAAGIPFIICLFLQWMSHEFIRPRLVVDAEKKTLTISKAYGLGTYQPIDADDLDQISIVSVGDVSVVRLHFEKFQLFKPQSGAIGTGEIHDFKSRLERLGIDVQDRNVPPVPFSIDAVRTRFITTPIAIVGSLLAVWRLFGPDAFWTNTVVVPALMMVGFAMYSYWWRFRLRRADGD